MKYTLLIYTDEKMEANATQEEQNTVMAEYFAFTEAVRKAGVYHGGEALHPTSSSTTVRVRDGKTVTTHGPFAETKEQLGGYYLLDCPNLDEAIKWASQIPGARYGSVEIRPIMDFSQYQPS
jgi:hypothetical protein